MKKGTALKRGKKKGQKKKKKVQTLPAPTSFPPTNQYTAPDPRQSLFLSLYLDPMSETFSNGLQSALKAGYAQEYAESLLAKMPEWLSENVGDVSRIKKAEQHLDEVLQVPILVQAMGAFGPLVKKIPTGKFKIVTKKGRRKRVEICREEPIMVYSTSIIKEKSKVMEFALSSLSKLKYGKPAAGGSKLPPIVPIQININDDREKYA